MIIASQLYIGLFLLLASAFFSLSETALVSLSAQKVKRLALHNPALAHAFIRWLNRPHELLTTILVGNTLVNILFASLVTSWVVQALHFDTPTRMKIWAWVFETFLLVIAGEMVPKLVARASPEKMSLVVLPLLSTARRFLLPLLNFVSIFSDLFFKKWKTTASSSDVTFSVQELKGLLEEVPEATDVSSDAYGMIRRILEIHDRKAESMMTPLKDVDIIEIDPPGKAPRERELLLDLIVEEGHTRTPVKYQGSLIGFIHTADLLLLILKEEGKDLRSMVRKAMDVPAHRSVYDLLQDFKTSGVHAGFVRNVQNDIIGLVTLEDVLEEITGEILDEYDLTQGPT
ncbi:MAG: hemolysin family protein [Elusimicrobia bacterium]|nr:hemolysin family protein [Candidatus Obscuribacterium magneticum]